MKTDIRLATCLIIRNGNLFLSGVCPVSGSLIWRTSPWSAWQTRIRANARSIAEKTGGRIYLFNPIVGQIREYVG